MKLPAAARTRSASTEQVVRTWPSVPFWLRRKASRETHLALPGAAVAATAILAVLMAEPSLYRPGLRLFALSLPAGSLTVFSLLAPVATFLMLAGRRRSGGGWWQWTDWLPVCGLFAVARAPADSERARYGLLPDLPQAAVQSRLGGATATIPERARGLLASLPARGSLIWQGLLYGSHLGWLLAAAGQLAEPGGIWASLLGGIVGLHLLAFAGAQLMTRSAKRRNALSAAHWADALVSPCLLLPVPFNLAGLGFWLSPRTRARTDSLAAGMFGAQNPFSRLAGFRRLLPVGGGFALHLRGWNGDPFSRLPDWRLQSELKWTELHRVALFFQALALLGALGALESPLHDWLPDLFPVLLAVSVGASCLHAILLISGWVRRSSRALSGLGRSPGIAFAIALAMAASPVWSLHADRPFSWLAQVSWIAAALSILRLPLDVLVSGERIRALPAALLRAMTFVGLAILLTVAGAGQALTAAAQIRLVAMLAGASFFAPCLFVHLAGKRQAPSLVRSRWLRLPFSALLLPVLPSRLPGGIAAARPPWAHKGGAGAPPRSWP